MKTLFEFDIQKTIEVEKTEEQADGSKLTKKVKDSKPVTFALKRPSRIETDSGDVFYNVEFGRNVRAGMLTTALVDKMYGNEGGIFSQVEIEEYSNAYIKLGGNLGEIYDLEKKEAKTEEDTAKIKELYENNTELRQIISNYENARNSIYNNTAEVIARNKTLFWWLLTLIYQKNGDKYSPVFTGDTFEQKGETFDELVDLSESDDINKDYYAEIVSKSSSLVSLWFMSRAQNAEEFAKLAKDYLESEEPSKIEVKDNIEDTEVKE
jgi:hypothetical protein